MLSQALCPDGGVSFLRMLGDFIFPPMVFPDRQEPPEAWPALSEFRDARPLAGYVRGVFFVGADDLSKLATGGKVFLRRVLPVFADRLFDLENRELGQVVDQIRNKRFCLTFREVMTVIVDG